MWPAPASLVARLRQPHADRRIGDRRAEDRHVGAVGRGQDAVAARSPSRGARRAGRGTRASCTAARSSVSAKAAIHSSLSTELFLAGVGVVDAIDALGLQRRIVGMRRADVVMPAARFVQVVVEVGAGRDEAVDVAVGDEVRDDQPQAAGAERAGHAEEDRAVVAEHLLPDAARGGEIAPLKRNALHPREDFVGRKVRLDANGSTGARRKRDFVFMPPILCHEPEDPKVRSTHRDESRQRCRRRTRRMPGRRAAASKGATHAAEDSGGRVAVDRIVGPGARRPQRSAADSDRARRRARARRRRTCGNHVEPDRAIPRLHRHRQRRPSAGSAGRSATIRTLAAGRPAGIADRRSRPPPATRPRLRRRHRGADRWCRARSRTPQRTGRDRRRRTAVVLEAVPMRRANADASGQDRVTRRGLAESRARRTRRTVASAVGTRARSWPHSTAAFDWHAFLGADRVPELAPAVVNPSRADRPELTMHADPRAAGGAAERVRLEIRTPPVTVSAQRSGGSATARR